MMGQGRWLVGPAIAVLVVGVVLGQSTMTGIAVAGTLEECQVAYDSGDLVASRLAAEALLREDPGSYAAAWRLARVLIDLGNKEADKPTREDLYRQAEAAARLAVSLRPDDTWGHHYLAAAVGKIALSAGGKRKIELSKEVRDEAQRAVELDPRNDKSLHILGRWNREVANLSPVLKLAAKVVYGGVPKGASNENAIDYFQRAIEVNPQHVNHHLEFGITLMEVRNYPAAIAEFETALALPARDPNDPQYKEDAERWLKKARGRAAEPRTDRSR